MEQRPTTTEPFVIERTYNAPVAKVWQAITDKDKMKEWYFDVPEFKPEVGCVFTFSGGPPEKSYLHICKVTRVIPNQVLAHTWRYDGYEGDSDVTWELFDENGRTRVKLTHTGLHTFPPLQDFARENFAMGWTHIVGTGLQEYLGEKS